MSEAAIPSTIDVEVAKIIAMIIKSELDLDESHCLLGNQDWDIPADKELFVVVFDQAGPPFGAANFLETDADSPNAGKEIQQASVLHDVRIDMMSYNASARLRKEELGLALGSMLAQQLAAKYDVQIGRATQPVDASDTEVTRRMQKFVTHVKVTALHQKIKTPPAADYYDKFNIRPGYAGAVNPPSISDQE